MIYLALIGMGACHAAVATASSAASFEYLYIVSNEGGSSGGHTAIRFDRDVYHFQSESGLLVLKRDRAHEFLYRYALLDNRTIHSTRIAVSGETRTSLVDRFRQRHRAQEAQIRVAGALLADRKLLESLHDHEKDLERVPQNPLSRPTLPILGLGYFEEPRRDRQFFAGEEAPQLVEPSRALIVLQQEILRAHGIDFLNDRRQILTDAMRALAEDDPTAWAVETPASVYDYPPFARSYSSRLHDLAAGLAALDVLEDARRLAAASHHAPDDAYFDLRPKEVQAFERYAEELIEQLVDLADSDRDDWGEPFLVGMARLESLSRSVESRRLVFLDAFPDDSKTIHITDRDRSDGVATKMRLENQRQLDGSRAYFETNETAGELAWERIEERGNRYLEILRATRNGSLIRVAPGHLVPSRTAPYPLPRRMASDTNRRSKEIEHAREREAAYSHDLRSLHRYGLVDQNCATALFETINDSMDGSVESSRMQLGGYVPDRNSLSFIPFVSAREVNEQYTVVSIEILPSYRHQRLREMRDQESGIRVALRESNPFTATSYDRSSADSFFVFFTDEAILLRPFFGVVNLTAALGQSILGILTAPVDRGENLIQGLRGAFVSLPELAFANIRKGTNDWVPEEHRSLDPVQP